MRTIFSLLFVLFLASPSFAASLTEQQKINALLDSLTTSGVTFIRNGEAHDGAAARKHLEDKLKDTKDVNTAEDFITKVASVSSHTGKPYLVKLKNGSEMESNTWLHQKLNEIEAK